MALLFGRPGALAALPDPDPQVALTPVRRIGEHLTLGGARAVDVAGHPRLDFTLAWSRLSAAEVALLEQFHSGAAGPGPFWLLPVDVPEWNFLHPITAATTSLTFDTTGWATDAPHTLASATTPVLRGPRALRWQLAADTANTRWLRPNSGLAPALPISGTGTWTFTLDARTVTGTATLFAQLEGVTSASGPDTPLSTAWTQVSVTHTPPAGGDVRPLIGARPGTAADVIIDRPRLTYSPTARPWTPGRGVPLVAVTDLAITVRWADTFDVSMSLLEVG